MVNNVRIWKCLDNRVYNYCETEKIVYFNSRGNNSLGFLDMETGKMYFNTKYKNQFRRAVGEIKHDYCDKILSFNEYFNLV